MSKLYFIQAGERGPIKIGHSAKPRMRMAELQVGNHCKLRMLAEIDFSNGQRGTQTAADMEDLWHRTFRVIQIRGEWFEPTPQLLKAIGYMRDNLPFVAEPDGDVYLVEQN